MYKIPAKTLFTGKNLVFVPECHSTNVLALELSQKKGAAEGTMVITNNQTRGKGQVGNVWSSEPGKNLTLSLIIKPTFLAIPDQFYLNMAASLALHDLLKTVTAETVRIKWPNDILINEKKTCGILIENQIQGNSITYTIIGIGLNINQVRFNEKRATSLKLITGLDYNLQAMLDELCAYFEQWYIKLREGKSNEIRQAYYGCLYKMEEQATFSDKVGSFDGQIEGVDDVGRLIVNTGQGIRYFNTKEVQFNFP